MSDLQKKNAGEAAAAHVEAGMIVGLGTGSTAAWFVKALAARNLSGLRCVPTSEKTADLARDLGLTLSTLEDTPRIDLTVDGADEVGPGLALIKGGGAALLREKLVWEASTRCIVIADAAKVVPVLGTFPLPIEVVAFGHKTTANRIADVLIDHEIKQPARVRQADRGLVRTDGGNLIYDAACKAISDPVRLADDLKLITGVVEHGLFLDLADLAIIGDRRRLRGTPALIDAASAQHGRRRARQKGEIDAEGQVSGQPDIHRHPTTIRHVVATGHLPQASQARSHGAIVGQPPPVQARLIHHDGPRPDQGHLAPQHVQQLRQLVDAGTPQQAAQTRHAHIVAKLSRRAPFRVDQAGQPSLRIGRHGAELQTREKPSAAPDPLLAKQHRPAALAPHRQGCQRHQGQKEQDGRRRQTEIQRSYKAIGLPFGRRRAQTPYRQRRLDRLHDRHRIASPNEQSRLVELKTTLDNRMADWAN